MRPFTVVELQDLVRPREGPCVSIFLPTHRRIDGADEDRIRFKNLVGEARDRLEEVAGKRAATRLMKPVVDLEGSTLWRGRLDGLAVFSAADGLRWFRVPMELPERVAVSDTFHVRPLVRYLQTRRRFQVLALARNGCRLFAGTSQDLIQHDLKAMPASVEEVAGTPQDREGPTMHRAGGHLRFHGNAAPRSEREDLARYFRKVDEVVTQALRDENAPVVLAGIDRHMAIYRSVSRLRNLAADGAAGSFDRTPPDKLHARVLPIAESALRRREDDAVGEYRRAERAGLAIEELENIGPAAVQGRLRILFIARGRIADGRFDRTTGEVKLTARKKGAVVDDVLDDIAESVLIRGGEVLVLEKDAMPTANVAAAVMRW